MKPITSAPLTLFRSLPVRTLLPALLLIAFLCTCDSAPTTTEAPQTPTADAAATVDPVTYPSLPLDRLEHIFENATYMDATFYDLPISINQSERGPIQNTIGGIAGGPVELHPDCKPMGHIWFQIDGKNVEEADIYFAGKCVGYVWYHNGQPAYSNSLTEAGTGFYFNILQSVRQQKNQ